MIVVFLTMLKDGQETRRISARVSCTNCPVRSINPPVCAPVEMRSRRTDGAGSGTAPVILLSSSLIYQQRRLLAGVPGFEPGLSVLETDVLTVDTIPLCRFPIADCQLPIYDSPSHLLPQIGNRQLAIDNVFTSFPCGQCACGNGDRIS